MNLMKTAVLLFAAFLCAGLYGSDAARLRFSHVYLSGANTAFCASISSDEDSGDDRGMKPDDADGKEPPLDPEVNPDNGDSGDDPQYNPDLPEETDKNPGLGE